MKNDLPPTYYFENLEMGIYLSTLFGLMGKIRAKLAYSIAESSLGRILNMLSSYQQFSYPIHSSLKPSIAGIAP